MPFAHERKRLLRIGFRIAYLDSRRTRGDPHESLAVEGKETFFHLHGGPGKRRGAPNYKLEAPRSAAWQDDGCNHPRRPAWHAYRTSSESSWTPRGRRFTTAFAAIATRPRSVCNSGRSCTVRRRRGISLRWALSCTFTARSPSRSRSSRSSSSRVSGTATSSGLHTRHSRRMPVSQRRRSKRFVPEKAVPP